MDANGILIAVVIWFFMALIIAREAVGRKIGFYPTLLISFFFSPVIGIIALLMSPKLEDVALEKEAFENLASMKSISTADELIKLKSLLDEGVITQQEF